MVRVRVRVRVKVRVRVRIECSHAFYDNTCLEECISVVLEWPKE